MAFQLTYSGPSWTGGKAARRCMHTASDLPPVWRTHTYHAHIRRTSLWIQAASGSCPRSKQRLTAFPPYSWMYFTVLSSSHFGMPHLRFGLRVKASLDEVATLASLAQLDYTGASRGSAEQRWSRRAGWSGQRLPGCQGGWACTQHLGLVVLPALTPSTVPALADRRVSHLSRRSSLTASSSGT
jgi:hypothetical protein